MEDLVQTAVGGLIAAGVGFAVWLGQRRIELAAQRRERGLTRWDEQRAEAIKACNEFLSKLVLACDAATEKYDHWLEESAQKDRILAAWAAKREYSAQLRRAALFLENDVVRDLETAERYAGQILILLQTMMDPDHPHKAGEEDLPYEELRDKFDALSTLAHQRLRERFQHLLSPK